MYGRLFNATMTCIYVCISGRSVPGRRSDRRHAHPREMVPRYGGPLPQLSQHHARARCARRLFYAPGSSRYLVV